MVQFRVSRGDGLPAYLQLVLQVREALRLGWLEPGDQLPTVREVVATSGVNPNTVLKAYRELELSGLVEARQGAGTFVTASLGSATPQAMAQLQGELQKWVQTAREAGLENEDIQALLGAVLGANDQGGNQMIDQIAITVDGVGKRYRKGVRGSTWALRNCSFALPTGRVAALVGSNGAGKTTLLSVLAGLLPPTEGVVQRGPGSARVSFVAQDKPLYRHFKVADMLRLVADLNRVWDQDRAERWLRRFDVPLDRACGKLSGGQQAQVSFAVAIAARPAVLLLDEPLSNLDPLARREVTKELLAEVADTGLTVLLSTHVVTELVGVADYLMVLDNGALVTSGDVDDLVAGHVRYVGPPSAVPPGPGTLVESSHARHQSSFLVQLPPDARPGLVSPPWTARPVTLEELVVALLERSRSGRSAVAA